MPKSLSEETPAAKPGKGGFCEHRGFEADSKETGSPERESRGSAARAGSRFAARSQSDGHSHAGRHPPPPGWEKIGDVLTLETLYFFLVILYLLEKEKVVFLHWEQEGQQRNER